MMLKSHRRYLSASRGFTLIELLTSVALSSVILLFLFGLINQSSLTYQISQSSISTLSESRAFFHFFESDLSSRLPNTPLLSEVSAGSADKVGIVRVKSFDEPDAAATSPDSDLRTSIYYVAFTQDSAGTSSPKLFRSYLDGEQTQSLIESSSTSTFPAIDPTIDEPLVHNVVSFKVQPMRHNSSGVAEVWTATSGSPPAFLETTIELIDDTTAARFRTQTSWQRLFDSNNRDRRQAVRTYTKRIQLAK